MALPLPLIFGAAALLILSKKKPKPKKTSDAGVEPDEAPGAGAPPRPGMRPAPKPSGFQDPTGGWIKSAPGKGPPPGKTEIQPPVWNSHMANRARKYMEMRWESGDKIIHQAGTWFILQRDAAMTLWPQWDWPKTMTAEGKTTLVPPGAYVPNFVYKAGKHGPKIQEIWTHLRDIAWDVVGYRPIT